MNKPRRITIQSISGFWRKEQMPCHAEMDRYTNEGVIEGICGEPAAYRIWTNEVLPKPHQRGATGFACREHVGNVIEFWLAIDDAQEDVKNAG